MGALMIQGTGSDVGKSVLVAGLCRAFVNRGLAVRPFKPQNMSNNAAIAANGGEMSRAQALQAVACKTDPHTDMNPVLLKPQADHTSQLVIHGRIQGTLSGYSFRERRGMLLPHVMESWERLKKQCDIVVVEGAGSPAEINLRDGDIANMGFARAAGVPVILAGDINRGGVIAAIVGTRAVLDPLDSAMICGFIINKFRGDSTLFTDGYQQIEALSGWRGYGIVPWLSAAANLPDEDSITPTPDTEKSPGQITIACPILPHIANFDDLDPLKAESRVNLIMVPPGKPVPANCALIILPGTKTTIADMAAIRQQGWDIDILAHYRRGGMIMGICGGYQMLGQDICDPHKVESPIESIAGLGLINARTVLAREKTLRQISGTAFGQSFTGFEMHNGHTTGPDCNGPFAILEGNRPDGVISADGKVFGTYVHGLFANTAFRSALLGAIGAAPNGFDHKASVNTALDNIAAQLESCLDIDGLLTLAREGK